MVRCVDCWKLVYRYSVKTEPILQNGVIESLIYESVPPSLREAIARKNNVRLLEGIDEIRAFNKELDCYVRLIVEQKETRWKPRYLKAEDETQPNYVGRILNVAMEERTCPH